MPEPDFRQIQESKNQESKNLIFEIVKNQESKNQESKNLIPQNSPESAHTVSHILLHPPESAVLGPKIAPRRSQEGPRPPQDPPKMA